MSTLIVRPVPSSDPLQFQVLEPDGEPTAPVELRPAAGFPVAGRPTSDLMAELRWYLETGAAPDAGPPLEATVRVVRRPLGIEVRVEHVGEGERPGLVALVPAREGGRPAVQVLRPARGEPRTFVARLELEDFVIALEPTPEQNPI